MFGGLEDVVSQVVERQGLYLNVVWLLKVGIEQAFFIENSIVYIVYYFNIIVYILCKVYEVIGVYLYCFVYGQFFVGNGIFGMQEG